MFQTMNPIFHSRSKNFVINFYFVQELFIKGQLQVQFISSKDQLATILTKPLGASKFNLLRKKLMILAITMSLRGPVRDNTTNTKNWITIIGDHALDICIVDHKNHTTLAILETKASQHGKNINGSY